MYVYEYIYIYIPNVSDTFLTSVGLSWPNRVFLLFVPQTCSKQSLPFGETKSFYRLYRKRVRRMPTPLQPTPSARVLDTAKWCW